MVAIVRLSLRVWPLSLQDGRRNVPAYGKSQRAILDAARRYAQALADEVAVASPRAPRLGRALFWLGHIMGWGGLILSLYGLATLKEASLDRLILGPFGIGLLMQIPSGALVRAGRRRLRPSGIEPGAGDRRRPVVLLRSLRDDEGEGIARLADLGRYGPTVDLSAPGALGEAFGTVDEIGAIERLMDRAVFLIAVVGRDGVVDGTELAAIARRRHGHKLLVLLRPGTLDAGRWQRLREVLSVVPGFAGWPELVPAGLAAIHLSSGGGPVLVVGPARSRAGVSALAVDFAVYGMKCHGRW